MLSRSALRRPDPSDVESRSSIGYQPPAPETVPRAEHRLEAAAGARSAANGRWQPAPVISRPASEEPANRAGLRRLVDSVLRGLPETPFFDRMFATALFLKAHRRWPAKDSTLINDYLHRMKTDGELDDVLRQFVTDKEFAKFFVNWRLGYEATPRTYAVFERPDAFSTDRLTRPCVLKPAHLSGSVVYFDPATGLGEAERRTVMDCFRLDWYRETRERNYKNLRRRVIAEELVGDRATIKDYKVFCIGGAPRLIQVDRARHTDHSRVIYTPDWAPLELTFNDVPLGAIEPRPDALPQILDHARRLSAEFEFLRVDFYLTPGRIYVGELTSCHNNALNRFGDRDQERAFSRHLFGT
jgi:hypothetical protein